MKRILLFFVFLTIIINAEARDFNPYYFDKISIITYSQDAQYIATAELAGLIKIYDSVTLDIVGEFEGPFAASAMEFSPDNLYIALSEDSYGRTNDILIYEIKTGKIIFRLSHNTRHDIRSISYRFDGQRLVSGSEDGIIKIWDTTNGKEIMTLDAPSRWLKNVSYSPDGNKIISASFMSHIRIWDANTGKELKTLPTFVLEAYASYSQDGTRILTGGGNLGPRRGEIKIYNSDNYDLLYSHIFANGTIFMSNASFILNSNYIIICYRFDSDNKVVIIMNYTDAHIINTYTFDYYTPVAISPDGRNFCYLENLKDIRILGID